MLLVPKLLELFQLDSLVLSQYTNETTTTVKMGNYAQKSQNFV